MLANYAHYLGQFIPKVSQIYIGISKVSEIFLKMHPFIFFKNYKKNTIIHRSACAIEP